MQVIDYLSRYAKVGTVVIFREGGSQIGMTRIDNEDLYLTSLSPTLLRLYKIVNSGYEKREWANVKLLVLDVSPV